MPKKSESTGREAGKKNAGRRKPPTEAEKPQGTPEYLEYLERLEEAGEGRTRLSPEEFDQFDDELLELLDLSASGQELTDDQVIRIQELEYLLIDSE